MTGGVNNAVAGRALWLLADLALVVALAVIFAYWTVERVSPRAVAAPAFASQGKAADAGLIVARHLFGTSPEEPIGEASSTARLRLLGVVAPNRAVLAGVDGRARSFAVGEALAPGLVLKEVHPDHVIVTSNGGAERLKLDRRVARVEQSPSAPRNVSR
jgi:general secretion pathway protein C